jgi:hypothetical protein
VNGAQEGRTRIESRRRGFLSDIPNVDLSKSMRGLRREDIASIM